MQKILIAVFCALLLATVGSAAILPCSTYASGNGGNGTEVNYITAQGGCTLGPLTLTGFVYTGATQGSSTSSTQNQDFLLDRANLMAGTTGVWDVGFNPGAILNGGDIHMIFTVTGGVIGADLTDTLAGTQVSEVLCTHFMPTAGPTSGNCDTGPNGQLWTANVNPPTIQSAPPTGEFFFAGGAQSTVYVWKDLNAGSADLSQFDETFVVPEPVSMVLVGGAFVGLGILRFRRKKS